MRSDERTRRGLCATAIAIAIGSGASCGGGATSASNGQDASMPRGGGSGRSDPGASNGAAGGSSGGSSGVASSSGGIVGGGGSGGFGGGIGDSGLASDGSAGSCLGASVLSALGKTRLLVGMSGGDAAAAAAPFDIRYEYISGGLFDGTAPCASCANGCTSNGKTCANSGGGCSWWGCYQYDKNPPGEFVRDFVGGCAKATPPQVSMYSYYEILQVLQAKLGPNANAEGAPEVMQAATDKGIMARYFADWRFLLQQIGSARSILHIEPDFWGYAERASSDPTKLPASVGSSNATDCGAMPATIAGMGQCMVAMVRKYAPNALVGLHASAWSTGVDVAMNTDPKLDVAGEARKTAAFLAACGESGADLVIVETSDRDAGYYASIGKQTFWDATNATLPDFHQDLAWVKALTESLGKPALYWQVPLGNATQNDTTNHWKDNRVDYFFAHEGELAAAHALGVAYGAGAGGQTVPGVAGDANGDGGNLVAKTNAYVSAGGQSFCP